MARLRTWALAALTILTVSMSGIALTSPARASADDPGSYPLQGDFNVDDPCALPADRYYVPAPPDGLAYTVDGVEKYTGWHSTSEGASSPQTQLSAELTGYDSNGYYVVYKSWTLTFTDTPCGKPVPNVYTISVGACDTRSGYTKVVVHMKNPDDTSDQPITDPVILASRVADGASPQTETWPSVPDGQTVDAFPGHVQGGLLPGTQKLSIFTNGDLYHAEAVVYAFVPGPCGDEDVPAGDPGLAAQHRPTAKLTKVAPHRMQVTLNNKRVARATTFLLVVDPTRGATRQAKVRVPAHTLLTGTCGATTSPAAFKPLQAACITWTGTTYTVKAKPGTRWVRLAHNQL